MLQGQAIAGNTAASEALASQEQKPSQIQNPNQSQTQSQGQGQSQGANTSQSQVFSPTMTDSSMAILSPPSSRYAFDPNASGNSNSNLPMDSVLSPLLASVASPVSELNFANLNISAAMSPPAGYGAENDVPAFQPETELLLENFTNDLKVFNNWVHGLNVEEQKTAIGLFIDSVREQEVIDYIQRKISSAVPNEGSKGNITFSPPLSANTSLPQRLRPVSPIIPISNMSHRSNPVPITLDSILNNTGPSDGSGNGNGNGVDRDDAVVYKPAPRRMLSPPIMKTGFSNIIEPIERPKSADPSYASNAAFVDQVGNAGYSQFGMSSPMSPLLANQPLFRVLSDGYQDAPENVSFNYYYNNGGSAAGANNGGDGALGTKLQQSLNTINNRSMIDSNRAGKEDRGRHRNLQNKPANLNLNLANMGMNMNMGMGMNMNANPKVGMNNLNHSMNMSLLNNGSGSGTSTNGSGSGSASALQNLTQSMSVPPHNRVNGANAPQAGKPAAYHAAKLQSHGYSKSGSSLGSMLHGSYGSSTSLLTEDERRALQLRKKAAASGDATTATPTSLSNGSTSSAPNTPGTSTGTGTGTGIGSGAGPAAAGTSIPKDIASDALLADIPAWLKTLRLHKYTENLQHLRWEDMVRLDDADLAALGVSTLGARNKLLKSFAHVRERRGLV